MILTPVTVVAGAYGCGKTTLIEHIIKSNPDQRFAVLVNKIDRSMEDVHRISEVGGRCLPVLGGCICCKLQDSFIGAMLQITAVRDTYDHILIEACGEADPTPLLAFADADQELIPNGILSPHCPNVVPDTGYLEKADALIPWGAKFDLAAL